MGKGTAALKMKISGEEMPFDSTIWSSCRHVFQAHEERTRLEGSYVLWQPRTMSEDFMMNVSLPRTIRIRWTMVLCALFGAAVGLSDDLSAQEKREDGWHVFPGESIQDALRKAALDDQLKVVKVHEGMYRPDVPGQALIWFNRMHEGIKLEAVGTVTLTAANASLSDPSSRSHPAIVNHVVYFGHGITTNTVFKGFRVTGANGYLTKLHTRRMEPEDSVPKNLYFFADGGGIKIFGRSSPIIEDVEVVENWTVPCGAGVSVQQEGHDDASVIFRNCVFLGNKTQVTGAAVDLLPGSSAELINCLFVGNASNLGPDVVADLSGEKPFTNSGVVTVFSTSKGIFRQCTFAGNRNGIDDMNPNSIYEDCLFWDNNLNVGLPGERYALDLQKGAAKVEGCFFQGRILDPHNAVSGELNQLDCPDPEFTKQFVPRAKGFENVGYRPVNSNNGS